MSRTQANLLLTLIALIWGSAFIAQRWAMDQVGPMLFTGARFLIGAAVVLPLAWRELRRVQLGRIDVLHIGVLGVLMALGAALQQIGILSTTVTNAGFLTALYVPLVPVLGWLLLRHLPHPSVWPAGLACLVGAFLLSGAHELRIGVGDLWVLASTLPWALHVLLVGRWADRMEAPFLVACGQFLVCGLLSMSVAIVLEPVRLDMVWAAAGPTLYGGVISVGMAFTAQVVAQRYAQAADAAIILSSETLFAAGFGYAMLGERLDSAGAWGCGLMLLGIVLVQWLPLLGSWRRRAILTNPSNCP